MSRSRTRSTISTKEEPCVRMITPSVPLSKLRNRQTEKSVTFLPSNSQVCYATDRGTQCVAPPLAPKTRSSRNEIEIPQEENISELPYPSTKTSSTQQRTLSSFDTGSVISSLGEQNDFNERSIDEKLASLRTQREQITASLDEFKRDIEPKETIEEKLASLRTERLKTSSSRRAPLDKQRLTNVERTNFINDSKLPESNSLSNLIIPGMTLGQEEKKIVSQQTSDYEIPVEIEEPEEVEIEEPEESEFRIPEIDEIDEIDENEESEQEFRIPEIDESDEPEQEFRIPEIDESDEPEIGEITGSGRMSRLANFPQMTKNFEIPEPEIDEETEREIINSRRMSRTKNFENPEPEIINSRRRMSRLTNFPQMTKNFEIPEPEIDEETEREIVNSRRMRSANPEREIVNSQRNDYINSVIQNSNSRFNTITRSTQRTPTESRFPNPSARAPVLISNPRLTPISKSQPRYFNVLTQ